MTGPTPARLYATLLGAGLIVLGIAGFFYDASFATGDSLTSDEAFGLFAVNGWHNLLHIATGLLGLAAAGFAARTYALAIGFAYTVFAIWGLLEANEGYGVVIDVLPVNTEVNLLHLAIGLLGLGAGAASPEDDGGERGPRTPAPA